MAKEPEDKGQFGDQGTRRISKDKIDKARKPEGETAKKDDDKK